MKFSDAAFRLAALGGPNAEKWRSLARESTMKPTSTTSVACPKCGARRGHPCRSSRIPSAATLGGGWGGYPVLNRVHPERAVEARKKESA